MPEMDGIQATQQIRLHPALKDIIVIGVSASAFDTTKQTSFKAGCNDFLTKPVYIDKLLGCLQRHLKLDWVYEAPLPLNKMIRISLKITIGCSSKKGSGPC